VNIRLIAIMIGVLALAHESAFCAAETLSEKLKRQTQEFSDASHEGNKKIIEKYLDPEVIFINEDGSVSGKKDLVEGAGSPNRGITITIQVTDWRMHRHGDVAVATFVDHLDENFFGQLLDFDYRSTEVWKRENNNWRMISSQTLTVQRDPNAVPMSEQMLEEYVGTYQIAPQLIVKITRQEDRIFAALNDRPALEMKAEARDVLFMPGQPGRKIFERDEHGLVTGYRSRRDGRDIVVKKIG
jgi:ketosteroid isomerase-like protein